MSRTSVRAALATSAVLLVVWGVLTVARAYSFDSRYGEAFLATTFGETMNQVLARFGAPSDVGARLMPGEITRHPPCQNECFIRLWYMAPVLGGISPYSVDFDQNQRVIGKYHWSLR